MIFNFSKHHIFLILLIFFSFLSHKSFANKTEKDIKIDREFACISNHKENGQAFNWKDVCSLDDEVPVNQELKRRDSEITKALDYESNRRLQIKPAKEISSDRLYFSSNNKKLSFKRSISESTENTSVNSEFSIQRQKDEFEIGTEVYHSTYKEPVFNLENKGLMYGVTMKYTRRIDTGDVDPFLNDYNLRLETRLAYGIMNYESEPSGTSKNIPDLNFEIRPMLAKDFDINSRTAVTPYFGFGFRYLSDDSSEKYTSTGAVGYLRESHYWYIPLGVEVAHKLENGWILGFICEGDLLIKGRQISHLDSIPGFPRIKNTQNAGYGLRGSIKIVKPGEKFDLLVEPYVRYWFIDDSASATASGSTFVVTGIEPENNTFEMGIKLGVQY